MSAMHQPFDDTCTTCGRADVHREKVRSAFWQGERLVVVEGIPAFVCAACGERFYDAETSEALQRMREAGLPPEAARCEVRVPVFPFGAAGARRP